ncbi:hypothetical protein [Methyloceanibacter superfactus]|nr:hypothetical protein [Methyloceanibacter superfactus]
MQTLFATRSGALAFAVAAIIASPSMAQSIAFDGATADLIQVTATVDAVDKKDRLITLTGPQGNTVVIKAGPKVRNFDRIKAGDDVVASYFEEISVVVTDAPSDGPPMTKEEGLEEDAEGGMDAPPPATVDVEAGAAVAAKGAEPGAAVGEVVTINTTIEAVEYDTRIVTLAGQNGLSRRVKVGPAVAIEQLKAGDGVTIQIKQAVAVDVQVP